MLERVDRIQLAVGDRRAAARTFEDVLGAETIRDDELKVYNARRTVVQAGESQFELLEPAGEGPVAAHIERWREGIFAAGFSTREVSALAARLSSRGVRYQEEGDQLFLAPDQTRGMRTVISPFAQRSPVGLIGNVYEATNIVDDWEEAARFYADAFALDASRFSPLASKEWGYVGTLTLFDPPARLDRIELTQTTQPLAMGRFYEKRGPSLYMCYAETEDTAPIMRRMDELGARYTVGREDGTGNMFVHPSALCGMLMGISRTSLAWLWSGRPELVRR